LSLVDNHRPNESTLKHKTLPEDYVQKVASIFEHGHHAQVPHNRYMNTPKLKTKLKAETLLLPSTVLSLFNIVVLTFTQVGMFYCDPCDHVLSCICLLEGGLRFSYKQCCMYVLMFLGDNASSGDMYQNSICSIPSLSLHIELLPTDLHMPLAAYILPGIGFC